METQTSYVLITGPTSGIGYELAKLFAMNGYPLILTSRNLERLKEVKKELLLINPSISIEILAKDLENPEAPKEIFEYTVKNALPVSILVNNSGFSNYGNFYEQDLMENLSIIQVNIAALTHLTGLFLPEMVKRGAGKILQVASTAAFQPGPTMAVYFASKAFVVMFSHGIESELKGTGVTVTTLCPGATATGFQKRSGIENIKLQKAKMAADVVARKAYKGLMKGKSRITPGFFNYLGFISSRLLPQKLIVSVTKSLMKE